ncbi:Hsp20/alpha crystallin family protein [Streptomyces sp. ALI-76-A]|uniref:Hsp20/alpha crystallin family protein n=1 Tax=Streptomyces sp. ALI-76-A TaxID=3025736 RepID=UPI00256EFCFA|nr:Hsp20/alpha crystallin family protein [Streptomyces sp. ALI-76-A]MDL5199695.1 Hsp20/alpha crystallin family protein [Streptomyces sp. ALI-76-A]
MEETGDAYVLELDVPGLRRDEVVVEVLDTELTVRGEVKDKERGGILRRRTRRVGQFAFRTGLPAAGSRWLGGCYGAVRHAGRGGHGDAAAVGRDQRS